MVVAGAGFQSLNACGVNRRGSVAFVLGLSKLVVIWCGDPMPDNVFAQQVARGILTFVLLAVRSFILASYLIKANGISVRLISLLQHGAGRLRVGMDVVKVLSMVIFSGISGSSEREDATVPGLRYYRMAGTARCGCASQ